MSLASQHEFPQIESFYLGCGYSYALSGSDLVLRYMENGEIVGAVRLCFEQGYLVLRGMYVLKEKQGMGVGSALLVAAVEELGDRECWCIPYDHLVRFYGHAGFVKSTNRSTPRFLQDRLTKYKATGKSVVAMVRNQK